MMKGNKWICLVLILGLLTSLAGCADKSGAVYVQSVASLVRMGGIAPGDLFAGLVVSENVTEITRDEEKTVAELLVREGDDVKEGDPLFSYDTEQLQLTLEKQELQLQQLQSSIENFEAQIAEMEKQQKRAWGTDKLQFAVQIQTTQVDLKEAQINEKTKESEVEKSRELLENATILSPVDGRVQAVNESGATDDNGKPLPYITIQQLGSYRIKGTINELQQGSIMEGDRLKIISRTDSNAVWYATVTLVDYANPIQNDSNMRMMGGSSDEMTSSSKYPFYAELDNMDGLLLGQHVYLSLDADEDAPAGLSIGSAFIAFDDEGNSFVWADNGKGKLEKRMVTMGEYNGMRDTYEILDGITEADYLAFPDETCAEGVATTKVQPQPQGEAQEPEGEV